MIASERFCRLFKEGFWIIIGQAIAVVGMLVGMRVLTQLLTPAMYGELALGMTVAALVGQTSFGPLGQGATRFFSQAVEKGDIHGYFKAVRQLALAAAGSVLLLIGISSTGLLIAGQSKWIPIVVIALIFAILSGYNSILNGIQNAARQRSIVALHQGIESWVRFLVAAGFLLLLGASSTVALAGYAIAIIPVLGSQYIFFRKSGYGAVRMEDKVQDWRSQIWKYSWPFVTWGIFSWAHQVSDRWALELFVSTNVVCLYMVLFQLGYSPIARVTGMAMQLIEPILYQRIGDASDRRRIDNVTSVSWRLTGLALSATIITFFITFLFNKQIFHFFVAKQYLSVSHLLPWVVLSGGIFAAGQAMAVNLMSQMKTRILVAPKIITAVIGIFFNFIGAYLMGLKGVVFAGVMFSVLYFMWMAFLFKRSIASTISL